MRRTPIKPHIHKTTV